MFGSLTSWDNDLFDQFNRLQRDFDDFWGNTKTPANIRAVSRGTYPAINVGTNDEAVEVLLFAAGLDEKQIDLSIQKNLLTINGKHAEKKLEGENLYLQERHTGSFRRVISLPDDIDPNSASAKYSNGVLQISVRRQATSRPRQIEIKH
jgi:HSP20 family protein